MLLGDDCNSVGGFMRVLAGFDADGGCGRLVAETVVPVGVWLLRSRRVVCCRGAVCFYWYCNLRFLLRMPMKALAMEVLEASRGGCTHHVFVYVGYFGGVCEELCV